MATRTTGRQPASPSTTNGSASPRPAAGPAGPGLAEGRRSAPMALIGVAAVVLGALVFLALYTSIDSRRPVLVVLRPVPAGQVIAAADVGEVRVSSSEGLATVAAGERADVVGKTAAVGLAPGALLAPSQVGAVSTLRADQAVVGIALKAGQAPASLRPGARVEVVDTVRGAGGEPARPIVLSTNAVVSCSTTGPSSSCASTGTSSSATVLVSLTLPAAEAPAVAAAGSDGRLSLIVLPVAP